MSHIPTSTPKKKRRVWPWVIFVLLLLSVAAAATGYYLHRKDSEEQAYGILLDNENLADYEAFLQKYPSSVHAPEVKQRLEKLRVMYSDWQRVMTSSYASDFQRFKDSYPNSLLVKQCDLKIDSLDWIAAQNAQTIEAINDYIEHHPDGRYLSEASLMQNQILETKVSESEIRLIASTLEGFFQAFGNNDEAALITYITPVMTQFLSKQNATKADVTDLVARTYNEHILNCRFVLNNDYESGKKVDSEGYKTYTVNFTVDQHITRDNPGKTFGSYTATATLNHQFKISSLTLREISRKDAVTEE